MGGTGGAGAGAGGAGAWAPDRIDAMFAAVGDGQWGGVPAALASGFPLGATGTCMGSTGWTLLHFAAHQGRLPAVLQLLAAGADVNARDEGGLVPIHTAAANCHVDVLAALVEAGADVNAANQSGFTPLYWATQRLSVARYLLSLPQLNLGARNLFGVDAEQHARQLGRGKAADAIRVEVRRCRAFFTPLGPPPPPPPPRAPLPLVVCRVCEYARVCFASCGLSSAGCALSVRRGGAENKMQRRLTGARVTAWQVAARARWTSLRAAWMAAVLRA